MKTIRLYGDLGRRFGREFHMDVASPAEAVRALCSQVKGFMAYLQAHDKDYFKVFVAGSNRSEDIGLPCSDKEVIRITPVIQGAGGVGRIILGAALVFVGLAIGFSTVAGGFITKMGASMILGGIVEMLSPSQTTTTTAESVENTPSYNFNGPINTEAQGHPVPLCYGRMIVGSAVISAGMTTRDGS